MAKKQYQLNEEQLRTLGKGAKSLTAEQQATLGDAIKSGQVTRVDNTTDTTTNTTPSTTTPAPTTTETPTNTETTNNTTTSSTTTPTETNVNPPAETTPTNVPTPNETTPAPTTTTTITPTTQTTPTPTTTSDGKTGEQFQEQNYSTTNAGTEENMTGVGETNNGVTPGGVVLGKREQVSYDDLFNTLRSGGNISQYKNTDSYKKAQVLYSYYNQFKGKQSYEYTGLISNGNLVPNTPLWNRLMEDPTTATQLKEAQNLNSINKAGINETYITKSQENQSQLILESNPTLNTYLADGFISMEEYKSLTYSPEKTIKEQEVSEYREEYLDLKNSYDSIEDEVDKELEGTTHTTSYRNALISKRRSQIGRDLDRAYGLYQGAFGDLTRIEEEYASLLNTNLQLYNQQQQRQWQLQDTADQREYDQQLLQQQREWQIADTESQRQYDANILSEQRAYDEAKTIKNLELNYQYTYGDLNSTNPQLQDTAIRSAIASMYTAYPIPGMESQEAKYNRVKSMIAEGMTPEQALAEVENQIRNSDGYKALKQSGLNQTQSNLIEINGKQYWSDSTNKTLTPVNMGDLTSYVNQYKGNSTNIGAYTNNPGNLAEGYIDSDYSIGGYSSTNGRSYPVFATEEDGWKALRQAISEKINGGSSWANSKTSLADFMKGWTQGPNYTGDTSGATNNAVKYLKEHGINVNANTSIGQIGVNNLAEAVAFNEGTVDLSGKSKLAGVNYSNLGGNTNTTLDSGLSATDMVKMKELEQMTANARNKELEDPTLNAKWEKYQLDRAENVNRNLTSYETTYADKQIQNFQGNAEVKAFENAYSQGISLLSSLNDSSGPGDVAAIFQFMKTLDPSSVVREGEFQVAAQSAGVAEYLGNTYDRLMEGKKLTDTQREVFGKLAKQFIEDKARLYDTKYNDMITRLKGQGIPEWYYPTSIADDMRGYIGDTTADNTATFSSGKKYTR